METYEKKNARIYAIIIDAADKLVSRAVTAVTMRGQDKWVTFELLEEIAAGLLEQCDVLRACAVFNPGTFETSEIMGMIDECELYFDRIATYL